MGGHDEQRIVENKTRMSSGLDPEATVQRMLEGIPSIRRAAFEVRGIPECSGRIDLDMDD